jgi:hypothetical protein
MSEKEQPNGYTPYEVNPLFASSNNEPQTASDNNQPFAPHPVEPSNINSHNYPEQPQLHASSYAAPPQAGYAPNPNLNPYTNQPNPYGQPENYYGNPGFNNQPYYANPYTNTYPASTNVTAILALVFAFVFPLAGIILGFIALTQIKNNPTLKGKGLALGGLITSIVFTLFQFLIFLVPFLQYTSYNY